MEPPGLGGGGEKGESEMKDCKNERMGGGGGEGGQLPYREVVSRLVPNGHRSLPNYTTSLKVYTVKQKK